MRNYYSEMCNLLGSAMEAKNANDFDTTALKMTEYYALRDEATEALGYDSEVGMIPMMRMAVEGLDRYL